ncbi:MAG TPA: flagellar type III secretion system pore protein FliP [Longimicrobiales bacterium]|nr:flagellar type III secretion system pore protein FliP [Longimicrobiales bacterium]
MTFGSLVSVFGALALVLALLAALVRVLRRYAGLGGGIGGEWQPEVLGRAAVGPRQGIAVVRIGQRVVVVSVGEGGVRPVLDLGDAESAPVAARSTAPESERGSIRFGEQLMRALRVGGVGASLLVLALAAGPAAAFASEPGATSLDASTPAEASAFAAAADDVAELDFAAARAAASAPVAPQQAARSARGTAFPGLPTIDLRIGSGPEPLRFSGTVGAVLIIGLLTLLPTLLLLMTSFTRILVVLHFLRMALGTQTSPPAHLVAALALLLTAFVMTPTLAEVNRTALAPWMSGELVESEMLAAAIVPFRTFMLEKTPDRDLETFIELSGAPVPETPEEIPLMTLVSAFATSELRAAFQIGFALFLPFIVIDLVVASVLMSMGMFMLPPAMISLPCKLLLFVLVDGWSLVVQGLVASFR